MSYLCQKCKQIGVTDFGLDIKRMENYPDFEKLVDLFFMVHKGLWLIYRRWVN